MFHISVSGMFRELLYGNVLIVTQDFSHIPPLKKFLYWLLKLEDVDVELNSLSFI